MTHAIEAHGLTKRFGDTLALDHVDLQVGRGTVLGLLGPNGAGKTTAVRILATLLRADAGSALVGGLDVRRDAHRVRQTVWPDDPPCNVVNALQTLVSRLRRAVGDPT